MHKNAKGILIRRGQVIREKTKTMGCAFFPDGSLGLVDPSVVTAEELLAQGIQDAWVFGPVLIANGELQDFRRHSLARNGEVTMRTVVADSWGQASIMVCTAAFIKLPAPANRKMDSMAM